MLKKKYIKSRKVCRVTFELPAAQLPEGVEANSVHLAGDFNDWDLTATPMKLNRKKIYRVVLDLTPGQSYQFRYVLNQDRWINDWEADDYVANSIGEDNCVVRALEGDQEIK